MKTVSAILLAAGESKRMGEVNKLMLPVDGVSLLRRTAQALLNADLVEVVVVLGHEPEMSKAMLAGLPVRWIVNEHYQDGQMSSVHCGLAALKEASDGVMVSLADQPLIESNDIARLIDAFRYHCPTTVLVPTYHGQRGNPIILAREHCQSILQGEPNLGCKRFIEKHPEWVTSFEMDNDHVIFDLDTPEDFIVLQQRLQAEQSNMTKSQAVKEV